MGRTGTRLPPTATLKTLPIDVDKDWKGFNIVNLGAGAHDLNARLNLLLAHASRHVSGGADEVLNLANINTAVGFSLEAHKDRHAAGGADALTDADIDGIVGFDLAAHASRHANGGADEITSPLNLAAIPTVVKNWILQEKKTLTSGTSLTWDGLDTHSFWMLIFYVVTDAEEVATYARLRLNNVSTSDYSYRYVASTSIYIDTGATSMAVCNYETGPTYAYHSLMGIVWIQGKHTEGEKQIVAKVGGGVSGYSMLNGYLSDDFNDVSRIDLVFSNTCSGIGILYYMD